MKYNPTVHQLRQAGFKVQVKHVMRKLPFRYTEVWITDENKNSTFGLAKCHEKDQYNKKLGCRIALGRAYKQYCNIYHGKHNSN